MHRRPQRERRPAGDFSALPAGVRLMGLDPGGRRLGVAISDGLRTSALPLCVIERRRFADDIASLKTIIKDHRIGGIILGLPLQMDGQEGRRVQSVRDFAKALYDALGVPLAFWDERLSTKAALRGVVSRKSGEMVDALAAAYILQGALDMISQ